MQQTEFLFDLTSETNPPRPPRVYLAARYSRHPEMRGYAEQLKAQGWEITSRWILGDRDIRAKGRAEEPEWLPLWAREDWEDLLAADVVVSFTEAPIGDVPGRSRGGRHVEFGAAIALRKRCVVVGYRENVFHWLPGVLFYPSWADALPGLAYLSAIVP